ncbi:MAG: hypothetical protein M1537_08485 [Nitrospirae bacterium]|jgi:hypothetical protein|nr:MAG: hypothetical protein D084_Lepto4C00544G0006 [Leptospirillum sp. Group IV 'UBA BS']MCL4486340.1 hypothetical protein [Nitrospirota bacterium]
MKNPFAPAPKDENSIPTETLRKWKTMQSHIGDPTNIEKLQPVVARIVEERVERDWQKWARDSGQVFPETFRDHTGRECTRYAGDIKSAFAPWVQEPIKVKLAETTHYKGQVFIRGQEPASVRRSMLLAKNGFSE